MVPLGEKDNIKILMIMGYGDHIRTHEEVCHIFNELHPEMLGWYKIQKLSYDYFH